nr:MAG TPA: hypothetical protein [Caudoviricetes sp.]
MARAKTKSARALIRARMEYYLTDQEREPPLSRSLLQKRAHTAAEGGGSAREEGGGGLCALLPRNG